jgi:hypothetical protein
MIHQFHPTSFSCFALVRQQIQMVTKDIWKEVGSGESIPGGGLILTICKAQAKESRPNAASIIAGINKSF